MSEPVVRPARPEEVTRLASIHSQAWNVDPPRYEPGEHDLSASRVLAIGDEVAAVLEIIGREVWFGPDRLGAVGLGGVATAPEHRRRGYCRRLLQEVMKEVRDQGKVLSLLWPFSYAFYRRLGWETGGLQLWVTLPLAALPRDIGRGWTARPVGADSPADLAVLDDLYSRWARRFHGCLVRQPEDWKRRLQHRNERRFTYLVCSPESGPAGYVTYAFRPLPDDWRQLLVREFVALDGRAHQALLGLLGNHDSQAQRVELVLPPDDLLLHRWPDRTEATVRDGFMLRVVDVKAALEGRSYPGAEDGELKWRVRDELCPWNDGVFHVAWDRGRCAVRPAPAAASWDLECDAATLSGLYAGKLPPQAALALGRLAVTGDRPELLPWLGRCLGGRLGWLQDFF